MLTGVAWGLAKLTLIESIQKITIWALCVA